MAGTRFLVVGTGLLGGWILELLARTPQPAQIVAIDRDADRGLRKVNAVARGARTMGSNVALEFRAVDLAHQDQLAETVAEIAPDVVMQTASLQAWWVVNALPPPVYDKVAQAGLGAWLPMHLAPTASLMRALAAAGLSPIVVSAPFPDAVNAALGKLAPTVGLGNMDELVPMIAAEVARRLSLPESEIRVWMVGHHFHNAALLDHGTTGGAPYFLRVDAAGEEVTCRWPSDELLLAATRNYPLGAEDTPMIASSAIKNALALLAGTATFTHAPGPLALPGGYPVRLGAGKVELALPPGLAREEAVRLNLEAQRFDGIESIGADGTVRCTDRTVAIMREVFGFDCSRYSVDGAWEQARELSAAYRRVAERS
ncbi:MAG: hypothetical protein JSW68_10065 [Burkholderiales bacterium]|nr:MAG: hypothetical protein JSW68_10065 [Burkholderiales bacterium]